MADEHEVGDVKSTPVRFHMSNGEKVVLPCVGSLTFRDVKDKIWTKKHFKANKQKYLFRLQDGEIFFLDSDTLSKMFRVARPFRESHQKSILEVLLLPIADVGDTLKRESKKPTKSGKNVIQGNLWKLGGGKLASWKRRYFVLQDFTMFYFESEANYKLNEDALGYVPMGSCPLVKVPDIKMKTNDNVFELKAEGVGHRSFVLCADTKEEMDNWCNTIKEFNFRRVKSITICVCEELLARNVREAEGLLRVSGKKEDMMKIKADYDIAHYPILSECKDIHAVGGVMKIAIREMEEPLLTFDLYSEFISLFSAQGDARTTQARDIVHKLPASNFAFLEYLMGFLHEVSKHQEMNKMSPKNLAIVIAPNILRPRVETVHTSMNDNNAVLCAVETMISGFSKIFDIDAEVFSQTMTSPLRPSSATVSGQRPGHLESLADPHHTLTSPTNTATLTPSRPPAQSGDADEHEPPTSGVNAETMAVIEEISHLRKYYEKAVEKWEENIRTKRTAANAAWQALQQELLKGVTKSSGAVERVAEFVVDEETWRKKALGSYEKFVTSLRTLAHTVEEKRGPDGHGTLTAASAAHIAEKTAAHHAHTPSSPAVASPTNAASSTPATPPPAATPTAAATSPAKTPPPMPTSAPPATTPTASSGDAPRKPVGAFQLPGLGQSMGGLGSGMRPGGLGGAPVVKRGPPPLVQAAVAASSSSPTPSKPIAPPADAPGGPANPVPGPPTTPYDGDDDLYAE